jgi:hypothetical protein
MSASFIRPYSRRPAAVAGRGAEVARASFASQPVLPAFLPLAADLPTHTAMLVFARLDVTLMTSDVHRRMPERLCAS